MGLQIDLLTKTFWPTVRTKQDLIDEHLPCIVYNFKESEKLMYEESKEENDESFSINESASIPLSEASKVKPKENKRVKKSKKKDEEEKLENKEVLSPKKAGRKPGPKKK